MRKKLHDFEKPLGARAGPPITKTLSSTKKHPSKTLRRKQVADQERRNPDNEQANDSKESQEFLIKIGEGNQTKIINAKTKEQVKDKHEALEVKKQIDEFVRTIPEKRKDYEIVRYC